LSGRFVDKTTANIINIIRKRRGGWNPYVVVVVVFYIPSSRIICCCGMPRVLSSPTIPNSTSSAVVVGTVVHVVAVRFLPSCSKHIRTDITRIIMIINLCHSLRSQALCR